MQARISCFFVPELRDLRAKTCWELSVIIESTELEHVTIAVFLWSILMVVGVFAQSDNLHDFVIVVPILLVKVFDKINH